MKGYSGFSKLSKNSPDTVSYPGTYGLQPDSINKIELMEGTNNIINMPGDLERRPSLRRQCSLDEKANSGADSPFMDKQEKDDEFSIDGSNLPGKVQVPRPRNQKKHLSSKVSRLGQFESVAFTINESTEEHNV